MKYKNEDNTSEMSDGCSCAEN